MLGEGFEIIDTNELSEKIEKQREKRSKAKDILDLTGS
jgi:hypothetical protein